MTLPPARYIVLQHEGVWKINLDNKYYGPFPTQAQAVESASGTARKAADAVLMVTGLDDPPLRLLLGRDVLKAVRDKLATFSASIDEWASVTKDVEFPRG